MGCDIHFYTERYTSDNDFDGPRRLSEERNSKLDRILELNEKVEPRWVSADKWSLDNGFDDEKPWWYIIRGTEYYRGRNYYLFSVLAGVRDYGDTPRRLSDPRGVPDDASDGYKTIVEQMGSDGHSHSYFTLEELLNVNWDEYKREDWLDDFMDTIERMKLIDNDPSKVRCVFFFDN